MITWKLLGHQGPHTQVASLYHAILHPGKVSFRSGSQGVLYRLKESTGTDGGAADRVYLERLLVHDSLGNCQVEIVTRDVGFGYLDAGNPVVLDSDFHGIAPPALAVWALFSRFGAMGEWTLPKVALFYGSTWPLRWPKLGPGALTRLAGKCRPVTSTGSYYAPGVFPCRYSDRNSSSCA